MTQLRQLELHLLRFLPHPLRDDFVTVGLLLVESDGGFADVRFTHDFRMLQCVAPDLDPEWFDLVEREIRRNLGSLQRREDLLQLISERFGTALDVSPTKAILSADPASEIEALASIYLLPLPRGERTQHRSGRAAIVATMKDAFEHEGVLNLMLRDFDIVKYTGQGDPLRIDFGFKIAGTMKMFHAVSVAASVDQALALAYRYARVKAGMQREQVQSSLTAIIDQGMTVGEEKTRFAIDALQQSAVRVRLVEEMEDIASEVRLEMRT